MSIIAPMTKSALLLINLLLCTNSPAWGFVAFSPPGRLVPSAAARVQVKWWASSIRRNALPPPLTFSEESGFDSCHANCAEFAEEAATTPRKGIGPSISAVATITYIMLTSMSPPAHAAVVEGAVVPSALWAYGHYFSILVIFGCLSAERTLVKADMTEEEENLVVKLDLVYGLMAALLIVSGLFRATDFGKGSEFYLHETLFWVKMALSGIWGGSSLFPSLTFYKRNFARKNREAVPPLSEKLAARLQQVINAELSAVLSIPLIATFMARGVWYWDDFPWPAGLALAVLATVGSFYFYGKQALTWTEDGGVHVVLEDE